MEGTLDWEGYAAVKALVHLAGRQRELTGHDIGRLCAQLVEPYRGEVVDIIGSVGPDKLTLWHQYSRYSPAGPPRDPLTPEFVRDMAEVARKVAAYTVEQFGEARARGFARPAGSHRCRVSLEALRPGNRYSTLRIGARVQATPRFVRGTRMGND